jgi:sucrose phosphorylase
MLNAYPDSIAGSMRGAVEFLRQPALAGVFDSFYVLPSMFTTDLDRGFSVISYDLNGELVDPAALESIREMGISLKLDFVLNHASVQSPQFKDIIAHGEQSEYADFFIDWNKFWAGCGEMTQDGYILPRDEYLAGMYLRKPGLPLMNVPMPNGGSKPYWNTFYQGYGEDGRLLGQMDLNINSPLVWQFYEDTLAKLAAYGADIVRLDAFAYASKEPGARNFFNDPGTWDILARIRTIADKLNLRLLPEIHAEYRERVHEQLSEKGYMTYDFFLPGLLIHALERGNCEYLLAWISDILAKNLQTINMLGCHDGIPLLDLRGLLPDDEIEEIIEVIVSRGGHVKNVQNKKTMYYQVNATYFSALGECDAKMLLARAVQLFMPGKPQIWYLDLFCGVNDHEAVRRAGADGHKEINRTNLSAAQIKAAMNNEAVQKQLELIRFRNTSPAFGDGAVLSATREGHTLCMQWRNNGHTARLTANFKDCTYSIDS